MTERINPGAFVFDNSVLSQDEITLASALAAELGHTKRSVHGDGKFADIKWFQVDLKPDTPFCRKILDHLGVSSPELLVFYYLEPGARIHPHRDLTGATLNNRLRFHVPVVTNREVDFRVSGERVRMAPGELWCLDTSYVHSVENGGDESRVHIVVECDINDTIRSKIPSNARAKLHNVRYAAILVSSFAKAVVRNSIADPAYFKAQMGMVAKFVGWRILKRRKPE